MTADWRRVVLMCDDEVVRIPVAERGDELVNASPTLPFTGRTDDHHQVLRHVRRPVLDRLLVAAAALPAGLTLALNEGYRPPALQRKWFEVYSGRLRVEHPTATAAEIHRMASRFISPPEIAPHTAGAAVDVQLLSADGRVVDHGCRLDASPEESGGRCYTAHPDVVGAARAHRDALSAAMTAAGFVNYPTEWWHWSYGDRYWALATGAPHALFGPVDLPAATTPRLTDVPTG